MLLQHFGEQHGLSPGGYRTYTGTPVRPSADSARVMSGSRRVQSARTSATFLRANAARTSWVLSTRRLFTWHVTHHAAVKSTNTGRPDAASSATRAGVYGCQSASPAATRRLEAADRRRVGVRGEQRPRERNRAGERGDAGDAPGARASRAHDAPRPEREPETEQREQQAHDRIVVALRAQHPREPDHRRVQRKREHLLEAQQPRARARKQAAPAGQQRERDVGDGHADAERDEDDERDASSIREIA